LALPLFEAFKMRYGLRALMLVVAIVPIALAALSANFLTLPLRDSDRVQATEAVVHWIVEDRAIPGFSESYPDSKFVIKKKRYFIVCDYLLPGLSVSKDSRTQRISQNEFNSMFSKYGFDETDYIVIESKLDTSSVLVLEVSNQFGSMGGHGYRFEFRRKFWGLRAIGKLLWVS
jgi:hypothetical protein